MRYILHNVRSLCKKEPFLFFVMIICIFSSAMIMLFSYGLYQNYHVQRYEAEVDLKELYPAFQDGAELHKADLVRYMSALSGDTLDAMDIIYTTARLEEFPETNYAEIPFRFCIRNGAYCTSSITREDWETKGLIGDGRYISDAEESSGAYVALIYYNKLTGYNKATLSIMNDDHTITLFDKKYNIIGTYSAGSGTPIIPFLSVPDDLSLHCLAFLFHQNITSTQYNDLVRQAQNQIPGVLIFEELDLPDSETVYLYNNIMLIAGLIAVLAVINFAALYHFIVAKRMRQIAVMRICGCTVGKAFAICLGECCALCIPTYLLGMAVYIPLMKQVLSRLFPYMEAAYALWIYPAAFGLYLLIMLVIVGAMLMIQLNRNPFEAWKDGAVI